MHIVLWHYKLGLTVRKRSNCIEPSMKCKYDDIGYNNNRIAQQMTEYCTNYMFLIKII